MTDKDIARRLGISHHTVSLHVREAMRRLGVGSRKAALRRIAEDPLYGSAAIPIGPSHAPDRGASDDPVEGAAKDLAAVPTATWILPTPPGAPARLGFILVFAAVAALVTVGLVSVVGGVATQLADHAPPNAIRTQ